MRREFNLVALGALGIFLYAHALRVSKARPRDFFTTKARSTQRRSWAVPRCDTKRVPEIIATEITEITENTEKNPFS